MRAWHIALRVLLLLVQLAPLLLLELACDSPDWVVNNAIVKCSTIGGRSKAVEVRDAGGWSHAYYELTVPPSQRGLYRITGEFYAEADAECDGSAAVRW